MLRRILGAGLLATWACATALTALADTSPASASASSREESSDAAHGSQNERLDALAGCYESPERAVAIVSTDSGRLLLHLPAKASETLTTLPNGTFASQSLNAKIEFVPATVLRPSQLLLVRPDAVVSYQRVTPDHVAKAEASRDQECRRANPARAEEKALRLLLAGLASGNVDHVPASGNFERAARQQAPFVQRGLQAMGAIRKMEYLGPMEDRQLLYRVRYDHDSILWSIELDSQLRIVNAVSQTGK
jgi:hypothetical protein